MGDLVTGDPVRIRRYENPAAIFIKALVRLALGFLIVVDSSMAIRPLAPRLRAIQSPAVLPLAVEKASTFMTKMVSPSKGWPTDWSSARCVLLGLATQRITRRGTSSDRCSGISLATQLRYTPLGARMKAKLIFPFK